MAAPWNDPTAPTRPGATVAVRTAMAARAPQVLRVLDAAVDEAQGNPPPRVAEVTEVRA